MMGSGLHYVPVLITEDPINILSLWVNVNSTLPDEANDDSLNKYFMSESC